MRWIWHTAEKSKSFLCEDKAADLFKAMFPDSPIAGKMSCGRTKQTYVLNFAIAPFCRKIMLNGLNGRFFTIGFDEADGRLGVVIRYMCEDGSVRTELLGLIPVEKFTARAVADATIKVVQDSKLPFRLWISDSSDNCNAMRGNFYSNMRHFFPTISDFYGIYLNVF